MNKLLEMLTYCRSHGSVGEQLFLEKFITNVPGIKSDAVGNYYVRIGESTTAFSCHVDTMHKEDGRQKVLHDTISGIAYTEDSSCLGADNAVGVWLLLELIEAKVPGLYLFHRGEERGGIGSKHISTNTPWITSGIKRMIAFDRKGATDVITHQFGIQTASTEFASALAGHLGGNYKPSSKGIYTDTYEYSDLVADCTNVSCGYYYEHTSDEYVDLGAVQYLRDKIVTIPWDDLPTGPRTARISNLYEYYLDYGYDDGLHRLSYDELVKYIQNNPDTIADLLIDEGLA